MFNKIVISHFGIMLPPRIVLVLVLLFSTIQWTVLGQKSGDLLPIGEDVSVLSESDLLPRVLIATLVRNKAHTLPYFLTLLENLDYPKDRIAIW
jgi:hypothetical protein